MTEGKKKVIAILFFFFFCFTIPFITVCDQSINNSTAMPIPELEARGTVLINGHGITSAGINNTDESLISSRVGSNDQSMEDHSIRQYGDGRLMREVGNSTPLHPAGDFGFTISAVPLSTSNCDQSTNYSTAMPNPQFHARQTGLVDGHGITSAGLNTTDKSLIGSRVGSKNQIMDHPISRFAGRKMLREAGKRSTPAASAGAFRYINSIVCFFSTSCNQSTNNSTAMPNPQFHARQPGLVDGHGISSSVLNNIDETLISSRVGSPNQSMDHSGGRKLLWVSTPAVLSPGQGSMTAYRNSTTGTNNQSMDHPIWQFFSRMIRGSTPAPPGSPNWNDTGTGQNNTTGSNNQSTDHPIWQHVKRTVRESPSTAAPPPPDLGENPPYWNHKKPGQTGE